MHTPMDSVVVTVVPRGFADFDLKREPNFVKTSLLGKTGKTRKLVVFIPDPRVKKCAMRFGPRVTKLRLFGKQ